MRIHKKAHDMHEVPLDKAKDDAAAALGATAAAAAASAAGALLLLLLLPAPLNDGGIRSFAPLASSHSSHLLFQPM